MKTLPTVTNPTRAHAHTDANTYTYRTWVLQQDSSGPTTLLNPPGSNGNNGLGPELPGAPDLPCLGLLIREPYFGGARTDQWGSTALTFFSHISLIMEGKHPKYTLLRTCI